jgi:hypothetical protein
MTPAQFWAIESQNQQNKMQRMDNLSNTIADGAKKAAAFLIGGPAGAAMASGMGGGGEGGGGGGLLDTIIGAYAQKEQDKNDSKIYGNLMKIVAPAFGKSASKASYSANLFLLRNVSSSS